MGLVFTVNMLLNKDLGVKGAPGGISVTALSGAVTALSGAITALSDAATALSSAVTALSGVFTALSGVVTALSGAITAPKKGNKKALDEPNAGYI